MNKTFRKAMLSTICMLVVAVVSLTGVTYAWFSQGTYSEVKGLEVQVESATGGILVAATSEYNSETPVIPTASNFLTSLDLSDVLEMEGAFGGTAGVSPVSTVGGANAWNFYTAEIDGATTITTAADEYRANVFTCYLYLMNTGSGENLTVNLGGNGDESPVTVISNTSDTNNIENAARLGLRYVATRNVSDGGPAATAGTVNDSKGYGIFSNQGAEYKGIQGASSTPFNKDTVGTNVAAVAPTVASSWEIVIPQETIVVVELMVWVEGQDAACINANAGSDFKVTMFFDRVPEEAD